MSAEDRAAVKGGLTDAQFNELLRVVRETVRAEIRAEFEGRRAPGAVIFDASKIDTDEMRELLDAEPGQITWIDPVQTYFDKQAYEAK